MRTEQELDTAVAKLEQDWSDFKSKVNSLRWLGGLIVTLLTALGITAAVVVKPLEDKAQAALTLNEQLKKVNAETGQAIADSQEQLKALKAQMDSMKSPADHAANPPTPVIHAAPRVPASRALRQVQAVLHSLNSPPIEPYYNGPYTQDIGQLLNCVDLLLTDIETHPSAGFDSEKPVYDGIDRIYQALVVRAGRYITSEEEPDAKNRAYHVSGWFNDFYKDFGDLRTFQQARPRMTDADIRDFRKRFTDRKDAVWGAYFKDWPQPLAD